jgi:hypothetical protein
VASDATGSGHPAPATPSASHAEDVLRLVLGKVGLAVEDLSAGAPLAALDHLNRLERRLAEARRLIRARIRQDAAWASRVVLVEGKGVRGL